MNWELRVYNPNVAMGTSFEDPAIIVPKATYSNNVGEFRRGFVWSISAAGNCLQMQFWAKPATTNINIRDIVQLRIENVGQFCGMVVTAPNKHSLGAGPNDPTSLELYEVVGLKQRIKEGLFDDRVLKPTTPQDVSWFVQQIAVANFVNLFRARYSSLALVNTGLLMDTLYMPFYPLGQVFDALAEAAGGVEWGVDAHGYFFFGNARYPSQTTLSLDYEAPNVNVEWLPIHAEEVVTKVTAIVLTEPSKAVLDLGFPTTYIKNGAVPAYEPAIQTMIYEDFQHNTYRGELVRIAADLITTNNNIKPGDWTVSGPPGFPGMGNKAYMVDNNYDTYAFPQIGDHGGGSLSYRGITTPTLGIANIPLDFVRSIVGFRMVYRLNTAAYTNKPFVLMRRGKLDPDGGLIGEVQSSAMFIPHTGSITEGTTRIIDFILPISTQLKAYDKDWFNFQIVLPPSSNAACRLYQIAPIFLDHLRAQNTLKAFIRKPAINPATVSANGLLLLTKELRLEYGPGELFASPVAEVEYSLLYDTGPMTVYKIEQPDYSDEALLTKALASSLDDGVIRSLRTLSGEGRIT